ncbi:RTX toxin [Enterovibrio norvegicus]|uniref:calcium-binding protein n=1 Tax=Enterovibrio norvegicus TaxID=188144 RepID=UPI000C846CBE|nr:calcium-binding protein [Enterovibrio norvegicus]MCC4797558.1 calcium-binding protein [Enterovibrio norvegicus]PMI33672.1 RTX toxin [Enterovibrio norvegicus]PMI36429.1 RTX toxin [Enterovibrio norvegicus]PMN50147.1 RTX toxin [Enterovibrio norvegicus]TKF19304.1 calcium-binding protein [Enterovibrio norvegicus]
MATITGDNAANMLDGTTDDDLIYGLEGNDTLRAYEGDDVVYGDSSSSQISQLSQNSDGSYSISSETFLSVHLSQFSFPSGDDKSVGYAVLDSSGNVLSTKILVESTATAQDTSAIDINVANGTTLVFFSLPVADRPGFEWRPLVLNDAETNIPSSSVSIEVEQITGDPTIGGNDSLYGYDGDDRLYGEGGDDFLIGGDGNDVLSGGEGDDRMWGEDGDDLIHGGNGDDRLFGQNGDDTLEGGAGDDELRGGRGNDTLDGGDGDDLIFGQDGDDTIVAGAGDDEVWADQGDDEVHGTAGSNYIDTGDGDDLVFGGRDDDEIYGGDGNDDLRGGAGNDEIYGEDGDDILTGKSGNDFLDGGDGNDEIYGTLGSNTLLGGQGDDYLFAGWRSMDNFLDGQEGADILRGSTFSDTLVFDQDDFEGQIQTLSSGKQINQSIYNASTGFDTLTVEGEQHADFTGDAYQTTPNVGGNVIAGIEAVVGGSNDQTVTINTHSIDQQSDDTNNDDWQGFVAWLGDGDDTLNLTGVNWAYNASATSNADITPAMIEKMGLTNAQVSDLQAYVFDDQFSDDQITIWTDAENITYLGADIV